MKLYTRWQTFLLCAVLALSLQSCLGIGENNTFQNTSTGKNGGNIGINTTQQAKFKGTFFLTIDHNLYSLSGAGKLTQLTHDIEVHDPAASPDGKTIVFVIRHKDSSDIASIAASGGNLTILLSGDGKYQPNPGFAPKSTHKWFMQPSWAADGKSLLVLSDIEKENWYIATQQDAPFLDLQVFSISLANPAAKPHDMAYALFGDGGLRDPSYRPGHADQITFTSYHYDISGTKQIIQLNMEDANAIANHPRLYHPGFDPSVALTPDTPDMANMQPAFSPDGNTILYVRRESATAMSMYTMPVAEGITSDPNNARFDPNTTANKQKALAPYAQSSKLLTHEYLSQALWSRDGKQIAYYDYTNNTFDLWLTTIVQDPRHPGAYSIKQDSEVQITSAQGHLDAESRPVWIA